MKKRSGLKIAALLLGTVLIGILTVLVAKPMLHLVQDPLVFRAYVEEKGGLGALIFMLMVIVQIILAFIPGEPFEIAAGFAFGITRGTIYCMAAAVIGSMSVFFLVRIYGMRLARLFFSEEKLRSLDFLKSSPKRSYLFFLLFMIPGTPKDLLCYYAGMTDLSPKTWLLICSVGRFPSVITSIVGGDAIGTGEYIFAAGTFGVTIVISGLGVLLYRAITKKHASHKPGSSSDSHPTEKNL
ncbi:MAG: TVP38/TMEM64 family protein [Lachnospiraceae bacterium]|nr:TVP38/TMEM64 family protein [Lachnospiraceae bacterium]